jgi:hypothetical protein
LLIASACADKIVILHMICMITVLQTACGSIVCQLSSQAPECIGCRY